MQTKEETKAPGSQEVVTENRKYKCHISETMLSRGESVGYIIVVTNLIDCNSAIFELIVETLELICYAQV